MYNLQRSNYLHLDKNVHLFELPCCRLLAFASLSSPCSDFRENLAAATGSLKPAFEALHAVPE